MVIQIEMLEFHEKRGLVVNEKEGGVLLSNATFEINMKIFQAES